jgi:hypothetical protein
MSRLLVLCLFVSGCSLYWGGNNGDDTCLPPGTGGAAQELRDPSTGQCEQVGGGGGGGYCCGTDCPVPETTTDGGALVPLQDWGACYTRCDALDASTCQATTGCHAAYLDGDLSDQSAPTFLGCWSTAPYGSTGANPPCSGRDAQGCSGSDACSMVYSGSNGAMKWEQCIPEPSAACNLDCVAGSHCAQQCTPGHCNDLNCADTCAATCVPDITCASVDCGQGYQCVEQCDALVGPCAPTCVPTGTDPGTCGGTIACGALPPSCPANTTAGVANGCWTGFCIPNANCGTHDPGHCYDQVTCGSAAPACPMGTLPGIKTGCYTGYCVPTYGCEIAACETLATQTACDARSDCTALYVGNGCTCDSFNHCTCQTETFSKCESLVMPL